MTDVIRKDLRRLLRLRVQTQVYDRGVLSLGSTVKGWSHVWALQDYLSMARVLDGKSNRLHIYVSLYT